MSPAPDSGVLGLLPEFHFDRRISYLSNHDKHSGFWFENSKKCRLLKTNSQNLRIIN